MVFSIVVFDQYHHFLSLVGVQLVARAKVFAGLTNVSGLAVAAFDLCIGLFVCGPSVCLNILDIRKYVLSPYRFVCNAYVVRLSKMCDSQF